ncbi:orotidine-5'-phosphate decarboxylase [Ferrimonas balearica]|uniref:orotidine-5'-phosphate decarboxylase n=1 Tax=Ferrimonas balearica TaxID=44012 RepID=UPI001C589E75|nr:orotidine-5'-phosphate decarboxylase [Ferrimonas balearica]MBW3139046.1 orotidine-5'-phosphate decarboxylase [Ferrimonas balearica]MBW3163362.1 orotidine-5'-phosphate decarboxylase [Ferrimonas balearica]MBY6106108.1 orotidine-5'-phosphate decarboxylase [Ferrimonas balearica]
MHSDPKVLVALDFASEQDAMAFVERIDPSQCRLKVGKEMFTLFGPQFVKALTGKGFEVFLDLKFHDIPNTVAHAVAAAAELGVWMVNVHATGGSKMMAAAKAALAPYGDKAPKLIAVTVLTSMGEEELPELGITRSNDEQVLALATLAKQAGLDGVVCSAQEAAMLKAKLGAEFQLVTPGIRPAGADLGDQRRVMTPAEAVAAGSDYLVIGRPITQSADPLATLEAINATL